MQLDKRMKMYEQSESGRRFMPLLPVIARIDGKCFHTYTRDLERPFDTGLSDLMIATTENLVQQTNAVIGYTQSDEITLIFYSDNIKSQIFFDGRIAKMTSVLASMTTAIFNDLVAIHLPQKMNWQPALFDCRVWTVPTKLEAINVLVWRELDATRNSIQMTAGAYYSHAQLMNKNTSQMQEMLREKGVNWNDYPPFFKRGTYVQRRKVQRKFTCDELEKLPPKHDAHKNPDLVVERTDINRLIMPPIMRVSNRVGVVFYGQEPVEVA